MEKQSNSSFVFSNKNNIVIEEEDDGHDIPHSSQTLLENLGQCLIAVCKVINPHSSQ